LIRTGSRPGVIGRASKAGAALAGFATLTLAVIISFDVLMRYFFNRPQLIVDEVAPFLLLLVIFGAAAQTFRVGGHVRVDLVTSHLRPAVRAWLRVVNLVIGIAFLAVVIWVTTQSTLTAFRYGRVSAVMLYPLWVFMLMIPAGLLLMALCMIGTLGRQIKAALGPWAGRDEVPPSPEVR
jgi:C4-dicarboxylate transporter, DctQ subunit